MPCSHLDSKTEKCMCFKPKRNNDLGLGCDVLGFCVCANDLEPRDNCTMYDEAGSNEDDLWGF